MEIAVLDYSGCTNTFYKVTKKELKNVLKEHDLSEDEDIDATVRLWLEKQGHHMSNCEFMFTETDSIEIIDNR